MDLMMKFLVVSRMAENRGIQQQRARQLGLVAGMIPGTTGLLAGVMIARRETPEPPKPPPSDTPKGAVAKA